MVRKSIVTFLFYSILIAVFAVKPAVLTNSLHELCLAREYVDFLEDPTQQLTLDDVKNSDAISSQFIPSKAEDLINSNTKSAYWLRFKLQQKSSSSFRIELFDYNIDDFCIYYPTKSGEYITKQAGFAYPFEKREINHKNLSFQIPPSIDSSYTYIRFLSGKKNVLEPMIRSYDQTINYAINEYIFFGLVYGLLLLIVLYNFIYFIVLKKDYYFYFILYGTGILIYIMGYDGTGFQYLWSNYPQINDYVGEFSLTISTVSLLLFTNSFLDLKEKNKSYSLYIKIGIFSRIGLFITQLFFTNYQFLESFDLIYIAVLLGISIKLYLKNNTQSAKWLVLGFSILNLSFIITTLERTSIIPSSIFSVYASNFGIVSQFLLLSIGIAETVKQAYKEKTIAQEKLIIQLWKNERLSEKVNRELEQKVKERTTELANSNELLKKKDEENIRMNIALDVANSQLKKNITSFAKSSITKDYLSFEEFQKAYPDEISCHRYLRELKDQKRFECIKCSNTKTIKGKEKFDVRCSKCNYNESVTANTIFHRTKLPLQTSFYMLYIITQKKESITALELSKKLNLQTNTCQTFKRKVLERLRLQKNKKDASWENIIIN